MVIETLRQRRESMAAEIRQLRENIAHIDAVIKIFEPDGVKPRRQRGEVTRAMLDVLRGGKRMTPQEIATACGLSVDQIRIALTQQRVKGVVGKIEEAGKLTTWEITR